MKKIQSTCNLCALACNLDFYVENGKIDRVSPTVDYPVNNNKEFHHRNLFILPLAHVYSFLM